MTQVVATAGHVDHGKSSLVAALTGMDPDRWAEEKRRGLTIDLGFAWCTLPSGREIGFVDVPGHERFVHNMLAGVGPVRLVLFVVAADEGWKPQSEEHLAIIDVLGVDGAVVAVTKRDLVDDAHLALCVDDVSSRVEGTALAFAPIVPVSSATGLGMDPLRKALDRMVFEAPPPEAGGPARLWVDRVFSIKGAGTVVTGTLAGGPLRTGDEVELQPDGRPARIRGLQSHKRDVESVYPVARVAANLAGIDRADVRRGDVLGHPGGRRGTKLLDVSVRPVRGLDHELSPRGAFKFYTGSAEVPATIRLLEGGEFARIRLRESVAPDVFDRYVIRDEGRGETEAGGVILDTDPPRRAGADAAERLRARAAATSRDHIEALALEERGVVRTGSTWRISSRVLSAATAAVTDRLADFHAEHPSLAGEDIAAIRTTVAESLTRARIEPEDSLVEASIDAMAAAGAITREGSTVRLASHTPAAARDLGSLMRVLEANPAAPPAVRDLGVPPDTIESAVRSGAAVRVSSDFLFSADFVARAEAVVRDHTVEGITVSEFREALGTTRKYAVPLLEYFDRKGITRREGDRRVYRGS